ncbi:MAG: large-conductance mechanosensitive channel protein MscL [Candidatus Kapaibacteriota bacterium]|jgi:large conductance mechanosensitive channel
MSKLIQEFKNFALKGNALDMAIGIILGSAFGKIVSSLVNDIIMPPIGLLLGGVNFSDLKIILSQRTFNQNPVTINLGSFIQVFVDFILIAITIFFLVKSFNALKKKKEVPSAPTPPSKSELLLEEIRDILKNKP